MRKRSSTPALAPNSLSNSSLSNSSIENAAPLPTPVDLSASGRDALSALSLTSPATSSTSINGKESHPAAFSKHTSRSSSMFKGWTKKADTKVVQQVWQTSAKDGKGWDIEVELAQYEVLKETFQGMLAHVQKYSQALDLLHTSVSGLKYLYEPGAGEVTQQLKASFGSGPARSVTTRALAEFVEQPLAMVLSICGRVDELIKQRREDALYYDSTRKKAEACAKKIDANSKVTSKVTEEEEKDLIRRRGKLAAATEALKLSTLEISDNITALLRAEGHIKELVAHGIASCQLFSANIATGAFTLHTIESDEVQEQMTRMKRATKALEKGEHVDSLGSSVVDVLRNMLIQLTAEAHEEAISGLVFGKPLSQFETVPQMLLDCIGFLDAHGLYVPGIFRVGGNPETIADLRKRYDTGETVELRQGKHPVHDVASLLKTFFRELPEPVIPTTVYRELLNAASHVGRSEFLDIVCKAIAKFPRMNALCLRLLFALLSRVTLCAVDNLMGVDNLAIVFAPNILRAPCESDTNVADLQPSILFVKRCIEMTADIWRESLWEGYPSWTAA